MICSRLLQRPCPHIPFLRVLSVLCGCICKAKEKNAFALSRLLDQALSTRRLEQAKIRDTSTNQTEFTVNFQTTVVQQGLKYPARLLKLMQPQSGGAYLHTLRSEARKEKTLQCLGFSCLLCFNRPHDQIERGHDGVSSRVLRLKFAEHFLKP